MLRDDQNQLFVQTGPGTLGGELQRRYWQPVALAEEMPNGGPPLPVRILGEDLVLFRDETGSLGLIGLRCSHRGVDLSYGRIEAGGLRCLYHGWVYDTAGKVIAMPGEPNEEAVCGKVKHLAYPCVQAAEMIFTYMGPGEPPLLPAYEFLSATPEMLWVSKVFQDCNHQQGVEGTVDPQHVSVLHETFGTDFHDYSFGRSVRPTIEVETKDYGIRVAAIRAGTDTAPGSLRLTNFVMPNMGFFPGVLAQPDGYQLEYRVPIDDGSHWKYVIVYKPSGITDRKRIDDYTLTGIGPDYRPIPNASNRYMQDREEMKDRTAAGFGRSFQIQDTWAAESQGRIMDRSNEHLTYTDRALNAYRRYYLGAVAQLQEGQPAPHVVHTEEENFFPELVTVDWEHDASEDWRPRVQDHIAKRKANRGSTAPAG